MRAAPCEVMRCARARVGDDGPEAWSGGRAGPSSASLVCPALAQKQAQKGLTIGAHVGTNGWGDKGAGGAVEHVRVVGGRSYTHPMPRLASSTLIPKDSATCGSTPRGEGGSVSRVKGNLRQRTIVFFGPPLGKQRQI